MWRYVAVIVVGLFILKSNVTAQENKVLGKTTLEWIQILELNKNPKARRIAIIALEKLGPAEKGVVNSLTRAVQVDKAPQIRQAAALALGEMGVHARSAMPALEKALSTDKSPLVREGAARAMAGEMLVYSKKAIPALGDALKDKDAKVRAAAALTLIEHRQDAREVMTAIIVALQSAKEDRYTRMYCAQMLSTFSEDGVKVIPLLHSVLKEKEADNGLKQVLVDGLGRFGKEAASSAKTLAELLTNKKAPVDLRRSAAVALVKLKPDSKDIWSSVKTVMKAEQKVLRSQAIRLAGRTCKDEPDLVAALLESCKDSAFEVQLAAVQELGELGTAAAKAKDALGTLARSSPRRIIRDAATEALKKLSGEKDSK